MGVGILLARETLSLLIGESVPPDVIADTRKIAGSEPSVTRVGRAIAVHLGPDEFVLNLEVFFQTGRCPTSP